MIKWLKQIRDALVGIHTELRALREMRARELEEMYDIRELTEVSDALPVTFTQEIRNRTEEELEYDAMINQARSAQDVQRYGGDSQ